MTQPTTDPPASPPRPRRVTRYWPDGTEVTLDIEAALDRMVALVKRVQARQTAPDE